MVPTTTTVLLPATKHSPDVCLYRTSGDMHSFRAHPCLRGMSSRCMSTARGPRPVRMRVSQTVCMPGSAALGAVAVPCFCACVTCTGCRAVTAVGSVRFFSDRKAVATAVQDAPVASDLKTSEEAPFAVVPAAVAAVTSDPGLADSALAFVKTIFESASDLALSWCSTFQYESLFVYNSLQKLIGLSVFLKFTFIYYVSNVGILLLYVYVLFHVMEIQVFQLVHCF
eukprot:gene3779-4180_t